MTHTWVKHRETGGYWQCPNEAMDYYAKLGWEPSEAPEEPNPAIAEMLAWRAAQAAEAAAEQAETKSSKPRRGASTEESES